MHDIYISKENFTEEVIKSERPVLVYFWAPWCSDCRSFTSTFEQLVAEYSGSLKVGKLNIEENFEIAEEFTVMSIPTLILFQNGKPIMRIVEQMNKKVIKTTITEALCAANYKGYNYDC